MGHFVSPSTLWMATQMSRSCGLCTTSARRAPQPPPATRPLPPNPPYALRLRTSGSTPGDRGPIALTRFGSSEPHLPLLPTPQAEYDTAHLKVLYLRRTATPDATASAEEDARDKRQRYDAARADLATMLHRIDVIRRFELQRGLLDSAAAHARFFGAGVGEMAMMESFFASVMRGVDDAAREAVASQLAVLAHAAAQQADGNAGPASFSATAPTSASAFASATTLASSAAQTPGSFYRQSSLANSSIHAPESSSASSSVGLAASATPTASHSRVNSAEISDLGSVDMPQQSAEYMPPQGPASWEPPIGAGAVSHEERQRAVGQAMAATARSGKIGILHCGYLLKQSHSVYQSWNVRFRPHLRSPPYSSTAADRPVLTSAPDPPPQLRYFVLDSSGVLSYFPEKLSHAKPQDEQAHVRVPICLAQMPCVFGAGQSICAVFRTLGTNDLTAAACLTTRRKL